MSDRQEGDDHEQQMRVKELEAELDRLKTELGQEKQKKIEGLQAELGRLQGDEGPKKKKKMGTIQDLRTPMKARLRSKPKVEGQEYLDMYVLTRDRARWERMERQSDDSLREIEKDMRRAEKTLPAIEYTRTEGKKPTKPGGGGKKPIRPMKTYPLDY